jgi:hypothetical protein
MPINYYCAIAMNGSDIEMNRNELLLPVIDNETSAPATGNEVKGQMYMDTTANVMYFYNGTAWIEMDGTGSGVASLTINNGLSTYVDLTNSGTAENPILDADLNAADGTDTSGRFLSKDNVWSTIPGGYTSWTINGDTNSGTNTVSNGETVTISGGKAIVSEVSTRTVSIDFTPSELNTVTALSTDKVVITDTSDSNNPKLALISDIINAGVTTVDTTDGTYIDLTPTAATSGAVVVTADLSAVDGTSSTATRFLSKDNTWDVPSYTTDNNTTYTLPTTNGNNPDIVLTGSDGSTDIVNMNGDSTTVKVTGSSTSTLTFDLVDDVTIASTLKISGTSASALDIPSGKAQTALTIGTDPSDTLTTKSYVDGLVSGGLTFKGTFRADTGAILSGGNSGSFLYNCPGGAGTRVAVTQGDYYVVATADGQFYCSGVQLDIGDAIIAVDDAAANSSDAADWSTISQGVTVNSFTNANGTYVSAGTVNSSATGAVTMGTIDLSAVDGTSDTSTKFLSKDNTWDVPSYTTNTDAKYELKANAKSGSNVPLFLDGTSGGSDSTVNLTEGAGITLTRNSATQVTIEATKLGTVESVALSMPSAFSVAGSPITSSGTFTVTGSGATTQYVDGTGALQTFPTIPQGDVESVAASTAADEEGIIVTSGSGPNVVVGLDIKGRTNLGAAPATNDELLIYDANTDTNKVVTVANLAAATHDINSFATTITGFGTITHNLSSFDVIVQLYNASNYETIYACVDRASVDTVSISGTSFPAGNIRVLVTKCIQ